MMLVLLAVLLILIAAFNMEALMVPAAMGIIASLYFLYIVPGLLCIGCISYLFNNIESGQFVFALAR